MLPRAVAASASMRSIIAGVGALGRAGLRTVRVYFVPEPTASKVYWTTISPMNVVVVRATQRCGGSHSSTTQSSSTSSRVNHFSRKVSPLRSGRFSQSMSCEAAIHSGHDFGLLT